MNNSNLGKAYICLTLIFISVLAFTAFLIFITDSLFGMFALLLLLFVRFNVENENSIDEENKE